MFRSEMVHVGMLILFYNFLFTVCILWLYLGGFCDLWLCVWLYLGQPPANSVTFCERFLELLVTLEAQLPTRRFVNGLLSSLHVTVRCSMSALCEHAEGRLFRQMLEMLRLYHHFEISEMTGEPLTQDEMTQKHYDRVTALQVSHNK